MKSYEVIRQAVEEPGAKAVAAALKVSPALVYKWCEPAEESDSGARNPLDRVRDIYLLTRDIRLVRWLCNQAGGFFVANPVTELRKSHDEHLFDDTRAMMREFSEMLDTVSQSVHDDAAIDQHEAELIRERWEDLKAVCENFVNTCEKGIYRKR